MNNKFKFGRTSFNPHGPYQASGGPLSDFVVRLSPVTLTISPDVVDALGYGNKHKIPRILFHTHVGKQMIHLEPTHRGYLLQRQKRGSLKFNATRLYKKMGLPAGDYIPVPGKPHTFVLAK